MLVVLLGLLPSHRARLERDESSPNFIYISDGLERVYCGVPSPMSGSVVAFRYGTWVATSNQPSLRISAVHAIVLLPEKLLSIEHVDKNWRRISQMSIPRACHATNSLNPSRAFSASLACIRIFQVRSTHVTVHAKALS